MTNKLRSVVLLVAVLMLQSLCAWGQARPKTARRLYFVNLQKALLETREGKQAQVALRKLFKQKQAEVELIFKKLEKLKLAVEKSADPALRSRLEQEQKSLQETFVEKQKMLNASSERTSQLLAERLQAFVKKANASLSGSTIVDDRDHRPLEALPDCDLTEWLIKSYDSQIVRALPVRPGCWFDVLLFVDQKAVLERSQLGQVAKIVVQKKHKEFQAELDRRTEKVKQLTAAGKQEQVQAETLRLHSQYTQFHRDLARAETEALLRFQDELTKSLSQAIAGYQRVLFLTHGEKPIAEKLGQHCEVTEWVISYLNEQASRADLATVCPALGSPGGK
ncbi:MAG: OmpH family outer membrane protein [Deltaproteobacteria bacterium]|nr:OmpH family outer membrane protein [Deltaproteobacteria bacterium]